ncbi:hypothetical protein [Vagococcus fluvialis]|uniref:hypothetical protein n=1 Tax=Vagococcus fluvialis TaxID=2738 RepID=UPI003790A120
MKKELRVQLHINLFFGICTLIGISLVKPLIEKDGGSFWTIFWLAFLGIIVFMSISLFIKWLLLRKKNKNIPDTDERTLENMRTSLLWAYILTMFLSSVSILFLLFLEVKIIEIEWLLYALIFMWVTLVGSLLIGKKL